MKDNNQSLSPWLPGIGLLLSLAVPTPDTTALAQAEENRLHGRYEGGVLRCDEGYVKHNGICVRKSGRQTACPDGYVSEPATGSCVPVRSREGGFSPGQIELQGIRLYMPEAEAITVLENKGFTYVSGRLFQKMLSDGTIRSVEIRPAVGAATDSSFRRLVGIRYTQQYPADLAFELETARARLFQEFGEPGKLTRPGNGQMHLTYSGTERTDPLQPHMSVRVVDTSRTQSITMILADPSRETAWQSEYFSRSRHQVRIPGAAASTAGIEF